MFEEGYFDEDHIDVSDIEQRAADKIIAAFRAKVERERKKFGELSQATGADPVSGAICNLMIREIDHLWQEHLLKMDHLRADVSLRTVGQRDPLMEFKQEAFLLFEELSYQLRLQIARQLFRFEMIAVDPQQLQKLLGQMQMEKDRSLVEEMEGGTPTSPEPASSDPRIGRNDHCPCGSGKKYKKCCGAEQEISS